MRDDEDTDEYNRNDYISSPSVSVDKPQTTPREDCEEDCSERNDFLSSNKLA
jgi:hypothetical protein